jgi:hypothetical protein
MLVWVVASYTSAPSCRDGGAVADACFDQVAPFQIQVPSRNFDSVDATEQDHRQRS